MGADIVSFTQSEPDFTDDCFAIVFLDKFGKLFSLFPFMPKNLVLNNETFSAILTSNDDLKPIFSAGKVKSSPTVVLLQKAPSY